MRNRFLRITGWLLMLLLATFVAVVSLRYFFIPPEKANPFLGEKFSRHLPLLLTHVAGAVVALFLGPWQLWGRLRKRYPAAHRFLGRFYLLGILAGGIGGFGLALIAFGGLPAQIGFSGLAVAWLASGFLAYRTIRQGKVQEHREWMIRNYALTLGAVMLRLWLPLFLSLGIPFPVAYPVIAWLSWVPNLVVAEVFLWGRGRKSMGPLPATSPLPLS